MIKMSSLKDYLDKLIYGIRRVDEKRLSDSYANILIIISCAVLVFYGVRYYSIAQNPAYKSNTLKHLTIASLLSTVWNLVLSYCMGWILFNTKVMLYYYEQIDLSKPLSYHDLFLAARYDHGISKMHFVKDLRFIGIITISMVLFKLQGKYTLKIAKDRKDMKGSYDHEHMIGIKRIDQKDISYKHTKLTSFKDIINGKKIAGYLITLIMTILLVPNKFLLNSSSELYSNDNIIIKFDHIFISFDLFFLIDCIICLVAIVRQQNTKSNTNTLNFICFAGAYVCFIITLSNGLWVLFNDLLVNLIFMMSKYITKSSGFEDNNTHIFTLILINYINHASANMCDGHTQVCSFTDAADTMAQNFVAVKLLFQNCLTAFSLSCFVLTPLVVWIFIIEFNLFKNMALHPEEKPAHT